MDLIKLTNKNQYLLRKDPSTAPLFLIQLLCAELDADVGRWGVSNPIWIYDNEPRNREILNRISKTIDSGDPVVILLSDISDKDVNDMVMAGLDVLSVIESNVYSGLEAKLKFNSWKKI